MPTQASSSTFPTESVRAKLLLLAPRTTPFAAGRCESRAESRASAVGIPPAPGTLVRQALRPPPSPHSAHARDTLLGWHSRPHITPNEASRPGASQEERRRSREGGRVPGHGLAGFSSLSSQGSGRFPLRSRVLCHLPQRPSIWLWRRRCHQLSMCARERDSARERGRAGCASESLKAVSPHYQQQQQRGDRPVLPLPLSASPRPFSSSPPPCPALPRDDYSCTCFLRAKTGDSL